MNIKTGTICENCGDIPRQKVFDDGGTTWCPWCAHANGDLTDKELETLQKGKMTKKEQKRRKSITKRSNKAIDRLNKPIIDKKAQKTLRKMMESLKPTKKNPGVTLKWADIETLNKPKKKITLDDYCTFTDYDRLIYTLGMWGVPYTVHSSNGITPYILVLFDDDGKAINSY